MSIPVLPQPNVNDDAVQWARGVTGLSQNNARELARVSQDLEMSNRATAGQMGVIGRQLAVISEQNEFLVNQTGGATLTGYTESSKEPAQTFQTELQPFDPEHDPELTFTTGASGKFRSHASFNAVSFAKSSETSYSRVGTHLMVGVIRGGVRVGVGARLVQSALAQNGNTTELNATVSGEFTFYGLPNTEYVLRAERYISGDAGVPGSADTRQLARWTNISISYTNLWN